MEAPLEGCVFLHVFTILLERGCANHVQLTARQHRLEYIASVHGALSSAGTNDGVHFIHKEDNIALGIGHFLEGSFEAFLKFAAVFCTSHHGSHVQLNNAFILESLWYIFIDDTLR